MAGQTQLIPENLPPGWRFHPSDEELLLCYLVPKLLNEPISGSDVTVVDLSRYDPWDLLDQFKKSPHDKEIYLLCRCEYNEKSGNRKRKARSGYWKCNGNPRPITLGDSDEVIGTKRSLLFHDPDATEYAITEYAYTAKLNSDIMEKFVLCKLKKKSSKCKDTSTRTKKAEPACKKRRRLDEKESKTELLDGNKNLALALTSEKQNLKEMIAHSTYSEGEQSNYMDSYLENQHPYKTTTNPTDDNVESTYSESTENTDELDDIPSSYRDKSTYTIANNTTMMPSNDKGNKEGIVTLDFDRQNPTKNTDISTSQEGERIVGPFDFDNRNQCEKADMSGNYWRSILASVGDNRFQGVESGKKDLPMLEDSQAALIAPHEGDTISPKVDVQQILQRLKEDLELEESQNPVVQPPIYSNESLNLSGFGMSMLELANYPSWFLLGN